VGWFDRDLNKTCALANQLGSSSKSVSEASEESSDSWDSGLIFVTNVSINQTEIKATLRIMRQIQDHSSRCAGRV
jgi:hypothetical protein